MELYTVAMYNWRKAKAKGVEVQDTTVRSGNALFAPSWEMVRTYKAGELSEEEYTKQYYEKMRDSFRNNRDKWLALFQKEKLALACYCGPDKFCHRLLLKAILLKIAEAEGISVKDCGEIK